MRGKNGSRLLALGGMKDILTWPQVIFKKKKKWQNVFFRQIGAGQIIQFCDNKQKFAAALSFSPVCVVAVSVSCFQGRASPHRPPKD